MNSVTYYGQGHAGCRNSAELSGFQNDGGPNNVYIDYETSSGDSGGPIWKYKNGDPYVGGEMFYNTGLGRTECQTAEGVEYMFGGYWVV